VGAVSVTDGSVRCVPSLICTGGTDNGMDAAPLVELIVRTFDDACLLSLSLSLNSSLSESLSFNPESTVRRGSRVKGKSANSSPARTLLQLSTRDGGSVRGGEDGGGGGERRPRGGGEEYSILTVAFASIVLTRIKCSINELRRFESKGLVLAVVYSIYMFYKYMNTYVKDIGVYNATFLAYSETRSGMYAYTFVKSEIVERDMAVITRVCNSGLQYWSTSICILSTDFGLLDTPDSGV